MTRRLRLVAGTLALALPLVAAAGCGAAKKKTVREEFTAAQSYLADSKSASVTLRLDDAQGSFAKLLAKDSETPPALVQALLKGSVTYTVDPAGDATFKSAQSHADPTNLKKSLEKVNLSFVVRDDKAELVELRVVAGTLYAHVNLTEVGVLAKAGGVDDFDATLDEGVRSMDPRLAQGLTDVRAGKWLKLPLSKYLDQLQDLAGNMTGAASPDPSKKYDFSDLGSKAFKAVKPYVKVTDANDSSKDRVLDIKVHVRPALKALLSLLQAEKGLPFASFLGDIEPSAIDKNVSDGELKGTITLHDSHLSGISVDLESLRQLSTDPGVDSFAGAAVTLDIDDSAGEVKAPTEVSTLDLGAVIAELIGGFFGADHSEVVSSSTGSFVAG